MKVLRNISKRDYMHIVNDSAFFLKAGEEKEVPDDIADIWLKSEDIILGADTSKDEELERLKQENEAFKKKEALLLKAKELGVKGVYNPTTKIETIEAKIAEAEAKIAEEAAAKAKIAEEAAAKAKAVEVKAVEVKVAKVEEVKDNEANSK